MKGSSTRPPLASAPGMQGARPPAPPCIQNRTQKLAAVREPCLPSVRRSAPRQSPSRGGVHPAAPGARTTSAADAAHDAAVCVHLQVPASSSPSRVALRPLMLYVAPRTARRCPSSRSLVDPGHRWSQNRRPKRRRPAGRVFLRKPKCSSLLFGNKWAILQLFLGRVDGRFGSGHRWRPCGMAHVGGLTVVT